MHFQLGELIFIASRLDSITRRKNHTVHREFSEIDNLIAA